MDIESISPHSVSSENNQHNNYQSPLDNPFNKHSKGPVNWFKNLSPQKKALLIILVLLIIVGIAGSLLYISISGNDNIKSVTSTKVKSTVSTTPTPIPTPIYNPLNGSVVPTQDAANLQRPPLAIMIENATPARPQSGLNEADIVYEALAEGGITRFMAVFLQNNPSSVGPVRSARTYYLDWASEYNPVYVHWGGNSDALAEIPQIGIHNLDAITASGSDNTCPSDSLKQTTLFCRDATREAPHNGYGNLSNIWQWASQQGWNSASTFTSWTFKDDAAVAQRGADKQTLSINFLPSDTDYDVLWTYNQSSNNYSRTNGGNAQSDRLNSQPIIAKTIIVQYVNAHNYTSSAGKVVFHFDNIGSGKVSIFEDGKQTDGTWKKDSMTGRTMYYDSQNNLIPLNRGKIWVTFIQPDTGTVTYK